MRTGWGVVVNQGFDLLSQQVVNLQGDMTGVGKVIADCGLGIEGVGIVLFQSKRH